MTGDPELSSVRVSRRRGDQVAEGEVRVPPAESDDAAAVAVAAALAWETLGRRYLKAGDPVDAVAAAQAGLNELGDPPPDPDVVDDTELKLYAAEERVRQGHTRDGASNMLAILRVRAELHARALGAELAG